MHVSEIGAPHVHRSVAADLAPPAGCTATSSTGSTASRSPCRRRTSRSIWDTAAGLKSFPAPGHASHHVCYLLDDGSLLAGDATGVRILPGKHVLPHAPPPDIDLEAWDRTFDDILRHQPERLALIHFGVVSGTEQVAEHIDRARSYLAVWAKRVHDGMTEDEFVAAARADIEASEGEDASAYFRAAPIEQSYLGLERYWRKKGEQSAEAAASA